MILIEDVIPYSVGIFDVKLSRKDTANPPQKEDLTFHTKKFHVLEEFKIDLLQIMILDLSYPHENRLLLLLRVHVILHLLLVVLREILSKHLEMSDLHHPHEEAVNIGFNAVHSEELCSKLLRSGSRNCCSSGILRRTDEGSFGEVDLEKCRYDLIHSLTVRDVVILLAENKEDIRLKLLHAHVAKQRILLLGAVYIFLYLIPQLGVLEVAAVRVHCLKAAVSCHARFQRHLHYCCCCCCC